MVRGDFFQSFSHLDCSAVFANTYRNIISSSSPSSTWVSMASFLDFDVHFVYPVFVLYLVVRFEFYLLVQVRFVLTAFLVVVLLMFVVLAKVVLLLLVLFIFVFMVMLFFV